MAGCLGIRNYQSKCGANYYKSSTIILSIEKNPAVSSVVKTLNTGFFTTLRMTDFVGFVRKTNNRSI